MRQNAREKDASAIQTEWKLPRPQERKSQENENECQMNHVQKNPTTMSATRRSPTIDGRAKREYARQILKVFVKEDFFFSAKTPKEREVLPLQMQYQKRHRRLWIFLAKFHAERLPSGIFAAKIAKTKALFGIVLTQ